MHVANISDARGGRLLFEPRPRRFPHQKRRGDGGVERLHALRHRDYHAPAARGGNVRRYAVPLVADDKRDFPRNVGAANVDGALVERRGVDLVPLALQMQNSVRGVAFFRSDAEDRAHRAAHRLRIENIRAAVPDVDAVGAERVGAADYRAEIAGIGDAVKHQRERIVRGRTSDGLKLLANGENALRRILRRELFIHFVRDGINLAAARFFDLGAVFFERRVGRENGAHFDTRADGFGKEFYPLYRENAHVVAAAAVCQFRRVDHRLIFAARYSFDYHKKPRKKSQKPKHAHARFGFAVSILKCSFCLFDKRCERFLVAYGELGEHLAVEVDAGLLETVHESRIVDAVDFRLCGDPRDPESTEISLFELASHECVVAALHDGFFGHLEMLRFGAPVTFGSFKDFISSLARHHRAFYSCHFTLSSVSYYF